MQAQEYENFNMDSPSTNILALPPEVLVMVFEKLNATSDILSCKNTCSIWKNVIESMFKDKGVFNYLSFVNDRFFLL